MIKKQRINLAELKREAERQGAWATGSCSRSRCYITDGCEVIVATTEGAVRVPVEQMAACIREMKNAAAAAGNILSNLTVEEKNAVAREKKLSYGKLQVMIMELGGIENERKNK